MNRKQRRRTFKTRLKIPATQLIDHKQLFGEQTLALQPHLVMMSF